MDAATPFLDNALLRSLGPEVLAHMAPAFQRVELARGQVVTDLGTPITHALFPDSGLVSMTADSGSGAFVEVGVIGREGVVGLPALLDGSALAVHRAIIQVPGQAWQVDAEPLRELMATQPAFRQLCMRYLHFYLFQTAQAAACNARHDLPSRLARWLALCRARSGRDDLPLTQEFLSYMLGVRRAGVSVVAASLQAEGVIRQSRGLVTIVDPRGLAARACPCYQIIEDYRRKILGTSDELYQESDASR